MVQSTASECKTVLSTRTPFVVVNYSCGAPKTLSTGLEKLAVKDTLSLDRESITEKIKENKRRSKLTGKKEIKRTTQLRTETKKRKDDKNVIGNCANLIEH